MSQPSPESVRVLMPARNQARLIVQAVKRARTLGPVQVVDVRSEDDTAPLAREAGASVCSAPPMSLADLARHAALRAPTESAWTLLLHPDEQVTPALRDRLRTLDQPWAQAFEGLRIAVRSVLMGRRIRFGGWTPGRELRCFRHPRNLTTAPGGWTLTSTGPTGDLAQPLVRRGPDDIDELIAAHLRLATADATALARWRKGEFASARAERDLEMELERLAPWGRATRPVACAPGRGLTAFLRSYFLRLGCLDGKAGLRLARMAWDYQTLVGLLDQERRWIESTPGAKTGL